MASKWPDSQVRREIHEFNLEFLELICADGSPGAAYGLDQAVRQRLLLLAPAQREAVAATPCLLAAFTVLPPRVIAQGVAEAPLMAIRESQSEAARLFAASLLAWLWHTARQDRLLAALCIGPGSLAVEHLRSAAFRDLQRTAAEAFGCLEARFCRHPRLWPDLVRAASLPAGPVLTATRLSVVQLTLISRH
ncbi:MAG: hypothetical protein E4H19_01590 [Chromatiales bacterium]|jgi:hypothetical protein|nr:MAG: hypothetical protein E4H19_01590 [Chromatiales bacterium]